MPKTPAYSSAPRGGAAVDGADEVGDADGAVVVGGMECRRVGLALAGEEDGGRVGPAVVGLAVARDWQSRGTHVCCRPSSRPGHT